VPGFPYLHEHIRLWIEKYESKKIDPRMCIVYVGVKQKTPFPSTIMETAMKKYDSLKELYDRDAKRS